MPKLFYYADGQKVPLLPADEYVLFSFDAPKSRAGLPPELRKVIEDPSRKVNDEFALIGKDSVSSSVFKKLQKAPFARNVYKYNDSLIVPLADVWVEDNRPSMLKKVKGWLGKHKNKADSVSSDGNSITFRAKSGKGEEAVSIANSIYSEIGVQTAQPNLLRVVPF